MSTVVLPPDVRAAVDAFRASLQDRFGARVREVRLFGSRARGEARADSDVDLLVLVDGLTWREAIEVIDLGTDEELRSGVLLAPLPHATAEFQQLCDRETSFACAVRRDGVVL
jgi:predicted nucleotidyltransferase